jgi:hypothetical protein
MSSHYYSAKPQIHTMDYSTLSSLGCQSPVAQAHPQTLPLSALLEQQMTFLPEDALCFISPQGLVHRPRLLRWIVFKPFWP